MGANDFLIDVKASENTGALSSKVERYASRRFPSSGSGSCSPDRLPLPGASVRRQRWLAVVGLGVFALTSGCGQEKSKKPYELSLSDLLQVCSPLESMDESAMIMFQIVDHSLTLTEVVGDDKDANLGVLGAKNPKISKGTWRADGATKKVYIELDGTTTQYTLTEPLDEECILFTGSIDAINLRKSWFGKPNFSEDE